MGKGKRTRETTEIEKNIAVEKMAVEKKKKRKNAIITTIVVVCIAAIAASSVFGTIGYNNAVKDGYFARKKNVVTGKNYSINVCMMQYLFNTTVQNFASNYSSNLEQLGLDVAKDLKEQSYPYGENESWYDYFEDSAKSQAEEMVALCDAANEKGMKLDESDQKSIDDSLKSIKETAEGENLEVRPYLTTKFGEWVSEDDVRDCLELTHLASKYQSYYTGTLKYKTEEISQYFDDNKKDFLTCDYISYLIKSNVTESTSAAQKKILEADAKKTASSIAKATTQAKFTENLTNYIKELIKAQSPTATADEIKTQAETEVTNSTVTGSGYDVTTDSGEWLFATGRKAGDTTVIADPEGNGYYVYYLTKAAAKDTSTTKNARHILLSSEDYDDDAACEKQAKKILKEYNNGKKTEESFAELAKKYSGDTGSVSTGGLYEGITEGQMVTEFNDWVFDSARKAGDTGLVKTDYGWHVMYYVGNGYKAWEASVVTAMKNADYTKKVTDLKEKYGTKVNKTNLALVSQYLPEDTASTDSDGTASVATAQ